MSCLYRPDGKKKAYVRLTADHDALDVANKACFPFVSSHIIDEVSFSFRLASSRMVVTALQYDDIIR